MSLIVAPKVRSSRCGLSCDLIIILEMEREVARSDWSSRKIWRVVQREIKKRVEIYDELRKVREEYGSRFNQYESRQSTMSLEMLGLKTLVTDLREQVESFENAIVGVSLTQKKILVGASYF